MVRASTRASGAWDARDATRPSHATDACAAITIATRGSSGTGKGTGPSDAKRAQKATEASAVAASVASSRVADDAGGAEEAVILAA
ncbi:MAG: hypothetical protein OHK0013_28230 [Sandaracinaceae bacterium]